VRSLPFLSLSIAFFNPWSFDCFCAVNVTMLVSWKKWCKRSHVHGVIIFYLIWFLYKKKIWNFFFKTETGSNRPVSILFGFLGQKPVQTGLARFFFPVFLVWVRFGFFSFRLIKPKPNPNRSVFSKF
jgi:hypothetical protein